MIIDTKKQQLKYNLKEIELDRIEQKIILLLSDNKVHYASEIRKYAKCIFLDSRINKLNQKIKNTANIKLITKRGRKYKIQREIYIM